MLLGWIWTVFLLLSLVFSVFSKEPVSLSSAIAQGAQSGITLGISLAGSVCLWCGVGRVLERAGISDALARLFRPVLGRLFPDMDTDPALAGHLSGNFCANLLGLGNAATPMGIRAAQALARGDTATDQLCRLVVLNTASIQLIPTTVAAVRAAQGCATPFDILPAVWTASFCSAGAGLAAAWILGTLWPR